MKYYIDDEVVSEEVFFERLEEEVRAYVEDNYDEILDEVYDEVKLGSLTFYASRIIKELDPIAYNCGIEDEFDYFFSEAKDKFENENDGTFNGVEFRTEEDDE